MSQPRPQPEFGPRARREARAAALQMLYAVDLAGQTPDQVEAWYFANHPLPEPVRAHAALVFRRALHDAAPIRAAIEPLAHGWSWDRLARLDRCILRLGVAELWDDPGVPRAGEVIRDCIALAKTFSQPQALDFVGGVLGAVAAELRRGGGSVP